MANKENNILRKVLRDHEERTMLIRLLPKRECGIVSSCALQTSDLTFECLKGLGQTQIQSPGSLNPTIGWAHGDCS